MRRPLKRERPEEEENTPGVAFSCPVTLNVLHLSDQRSQCSRQTMDRFIACRG